MCECVSEILFKICVGERVGWRENEGWGMGERMQGGVGERMQGGVGERMQGGVGERTKLSLCS